MAGGRTPTPARGAENSAITFSAQVLEKHLKAIYKGFDTDQSIEPAAWREVLRIISSGAVEGILRANHPEHLPESFLQAIKHSAEVFSAFKVHHMDKELASRLIDEKGHLKPFHEWKKEVLPFASHQVSAHLRTEYDTAVARAHFAASWQEFQANKDVMPNLRWMPTTSPNPDGAHRKFWEQKLTLPVDHPFWQEHYPGNRWNCSCALEATDEPATTLPADLPQTSPPPQRGLEQNPGVSKNLVEQSHSYFPDKCASCAFYNPSASQRLKDLFVNRKKDCFNCPFINRCIKNLKENELTEKEKDKLFSLPREKQFKEVYTTPAGGTVYEHLAVKKGDDYTSIVRAAKAFAGEGKTVELMPEINGLSQKIKENVFVKLGEIVSNPDLRINGEYYDIKRPSAVKNIVRNANRAAAQGAVAIIDVIRVSNEKDLDEHIKRKAEMILSEKNREFYPSDSVYFILKGGTLIKYNRK